MLDKETLTEHFKTFFWGLLDPVFASKARYLLTRLQAQDIVMVPYFGLRSLRDQGRMWRQSRTTSTVDEKIDHLNSQGCSYLAEAIQSVGPVTGPEVTDAIPGLSWHNWGVALDCYWDKDGQPCWDGNGEGYQAYAEMATQVGLTAGFNFVSFKDPGHVQLYSQEPLDRYSLEQVNQMMQEGNRL